MLGNILTFSAQLWPLKYHRCWIFIFKFFDGKFYILLHLVLIWHVNMSYIVNFKLFRGRVCILFFISGTFHLIGEMFMNSVNEDKVLKKKDIHSSLTVYRHMADCWLGKLAGQLNLPLDEVQDSETTYSSCPIDYVVSLNKIEVKILVSILAFFFSSVIENIIQCD